MRKHFLAMCLVVGAVALANPAFAAVDSAGKAQIQGIIAQYPDGGAPLAAAITAALEAKPSLADDVIAVADTATPDQQTAIGNGIAMAANFFAAQGTAAGNADAQELVAAVATGPAVLIAAADATISPTAGGGGGGGGATSLAGLTNALTTQQQQSCVSPSHAGPC